MTPLASIVTIILFICLFVLPRRLLIAPLLFAALYLNPSVLIFAGASFPSIRILIILSVLRVVIKREYIDEWTKNDTVFLLYTISLLGAYVLRIQTVEALVYVTGMMIDISGGYFIARAFVRSWDDVEFFIKIYLIMMIPMACGMVYEQLKHYNIFSLLGANVTSYFRKGRYRSEACLGNPILAGTFGSIGAIIALPYALRSIKNKNKNLLFVIIGMVITITAASSGAIMTLVYGYIGLGFWFFRYKMRAVRMWLLFSVILLILVMKAPIWYLIAKISSVLGGTGYHRAYLIDQAIRYFDTWWLLGTSRTDYWMRYNLGDGNVDITNHFLKQGIYGGIVPMILFIIMIVQSFKSIGIGLRNLGSQSKGQELVIWGIGCVLLGHIATFFSISYWDNSRIIFSFWLAVISLLGTQSIAVTTNDATDTGI